MVFFFFRRPVSPTLVGGQLKNHSNKLTFFKGVFRVFIYVLRTAAAVDEPGGLFTIRDRFSKHRRSYSAVFQKTKKPPDITFRNSRIRGFTYSTARTVVSDLKYIVQRPATSVEYVRNGLFFASIRRFRSFYFAAPYTLPTSNIRKLRARKLR